MRVGLFNQPEEVVKVVQFGIYMTGLDSFGRMYIIQTLQRIFTTSEQSLSGFQMLVTDNKQLVNEITRLLIETCKLADLVQICTALDAFYDIFAEEYYNETLAEHNIIQ